MLPASKSFDPKVFLSTIHPNATFNDLNQGERVSTLCARHKLYADRLCTSSTGRDRLRHALEQRSGAFKLLVEAEWDRFVAVKAANESEQAGLC